MNNEWIPINERLPEKDGLYLVSRYFDKEVFINICKFKSIENNFYLLCDFDPVTDGILAWMELPKPYEKPTREIEVIFEVSNDITDERFLHALQFRLKEHANKIKIKSINNKELTHMGVY